MIRYYVAPMSPVHPSFWSWILILLLVVGFPVFQSVSRAGRQALKALREGASRSIWWNMVVSVLIFQWVLLAIGVLIMAVDGVTLGAIGVQGFFRPAQLTAFGGLFLLTVALILARHFRIYRPPRISIGSFTPILPVGTAESWAFLLVGLTAAICEEILYRGFLITYLTGLLGNTWLPVAISATAFGLAHNVSGQAGWEIFLRVGIGLLFGFIFVATGNLFLPILVHFLCNASTFLVSPKIALRESELAPDPPGSE